MLPSRQRASAFALAALLAALVPTPAFASGFAIYEQGARGMGFAGAFVAQSDPSSIFHNAAGIAFLKGKHLYLGATAIAPSADFVGASPYPGDGRLETGDAATEFPPALDYTHQLSESLVLGVGVHVPYGLSTSWEGAETTYSGRFISKKASTRSLSINPTVAYKLADRFAVGAGLDVRLSTVELRRNAGAINPFTQQLIDIAAIDLESDTAIDFGFNLGVLAKPSESFGIGLAYRHSVAVDFDGTGTFNLIPTGNAQLDAAVAASLPSGAVPVKTRIEYPSIFTVGVAWTRNEWTVAADVNFQQWSSFDKLPLTFEGYDELSGEVEEGYQDSRIYRIGLERRFGERWAVRGGYYYDENPVPPESVSPLLPDADRNTVALGLGYNSGRFSLDFAYWRLFFKDRSTEGLSRDNYNGTYASSANLFAVSLGLGF